MMIGGLLATLESMIFTFLGIFEVMLIYSSDDIGSMIAETFTGYLLILALTMVPQILISLIFMYEAQHKEKYDLAPRKKLAK